jgi:hypothetical protein
MMFVHDVGLELRLLFVGQVAAFLTPRAVSARASFGCAARRDRLDVAPRRSHCHPAIVTERSVWA